ncbi:hypothetical protein AB0C33_26780 [Nonomuraea sp. NPDC048881]|uniref:hypothetical protein n=1 Tax=Nonomuraea sp. NPDC048881 TaxID=3155030 RepID=UPI0033C75AA9
MSSRGSIAVSSSCTRRQKAGWRLAAQSGASFSTTWPPPSVITLSRTTRGATANRCLAGAGPAVADSTRTAPQTAAATPATTPRARRSRFIGVLPEGGAAGPSIMADRTAPVHRS